MPDVDELALAVRARLLDWLLPRIRYEMNPGETMMVELTATVDDGEAPAIRWPVEMVGWTIRDFNKVAEVTSVNGGELSVYVKSAGQPWAAMPYDFGGYDEDAETWDN